MSEKQPQVLIFNATGELVAIARSIRSAAELTKVDENDIKLCCENQSSDSGHYCFRYNVKPLKLNTHLADLEKCRRVAR